MRTPYDTSFGRGWVAYDDDGGIHHITLPGLDPPLSGREELPPGFEEDVPSSVAGTVRRLEAYFAGRATEDWRLDTATLADIAGSTDFMRAVYRVVAAIPAGSTMTYAQVAAAAGRPSAARAVGSAMARNPFAPIIPCHRVLASNGGLGGYGGGLPMKEALLEMEGALLTRGGSS